MNKFELDKTMEYLGFNKKDVYYFKKLHIYHSGSYYTVVKGITPYELADQIYDKYDNSKYLIRVNGNHESEKPKDDVYSYHIDTLEGLIAYIVESNNYYNKNNSDDYDIMLNKISQSILKETEPKMSTYTWMIEKNRNVDYLRNLQEKGTELDIEVRKKIEQFDNMVNPFCNNYLEIDKMDFTVHGYSDEDTKCFVLVDKKNNSILETYKSKKGFLYKLKIPTKEPYEKNVYHYFDEYGEEIAFETYDKRGINRIEYNLSDKLFGKHYGKKHKVTDKNKIYVINQLDNYISLIEDIISNNTISSKKRIKRK